MSVTIRTISLLILVAASVTLTACKANPPAPPTPPSANPKLIPKLDPILALPQYPVRSPNGYEKFEQLVKKIDRTHEPEATSPAGTYQPPSREDELAAAPAQLADNREALQELRQALQMQWVYPHPPKADLLFPGLSKGRYLARLLTWEVVLKDKQGDTEGACAELLDVVTLGVKLPRGGGDMHWLVGRSLVQMAFRELKGLIAHHRLSPQMLKSLSQQLRDLERRQVPMREIIAFHYECQGPQSLNLPPEQFAKLLGSTSRLPGPLSFTLKLPQARRATQAFISQRLPDLMKWDAKIAKLSTPPFYAIRSQIPPDRGGVEDMFVLMPFMSALLRRQAEAQCDWLALQIMIALELDRAARGAYPKRLSDIRSLPAKDSVDPFSGKPFVYKRMGSGYTLYSVGRDGQDDGGRRSNKLEEGTDWVMWPQPLK